MEKENALLKYLQSEKEGITKQDIVSLSGSVYSTPIGEFEVLTEEQAQKKLAEALENNFKKFGSEMFAFTDDCDKLWKEICKNYLTDKAKETLRGYIEADILSQIETSDYNIETIVKYYIQTEGYFEYFDNRNIDDTIYPYKEKIDFDFNGIAEMINSKHGRGIYLSEFNHKEIRQDGYFIYKKNDKSIKLLSDLADEISREVADEFNISLSAEEIIEFVEMGTVSREELEKDGALSVCYL